MRQLLDMIEIGVLRIAGEISLSTKLERGRRTLEPHIQQFPLFSQPDGGIRIPEGHTFFKRVRSAISEVGGPATPQALNILVQRAGWREAMRRDWLTELAKKRQRSLILVPDESFVEILSANIPKRYSKRVIHFSTDMPSSAFNALAKSLRDSAPILVYGKRSANFLCLYGDFDEVLVVDPSNPNFISEQYPRYDTLLNLYLYLMFRPFKLSIVPLAPVYPLADAQRLEIESHRLSGTTDEKIHEQAEIVVKHAKTGARTLVFCDALGIGQQIVCARCLEDIKCEGCGRGLFFSADTDSFRCSFCGFETERISCRECGSEELAVQLLGVEGLAKLVRKRVKGGRHKKTPRVGALYQERREKIRVPNLARTDVLIGTKTLFSPIPFFRAQTIIYIPREYPTLANQPMLENYLEQQIYRLYNLYGSDNTRVVVVGSEPVVEMLEKRTSETRTNVLKEEAQLKGKNLLPPFGMILEFTAYSKQKKKLEESMHQIRGQLEFTGKLKLWDASRALRSRGEGKWCVRGRCVIGDVTNEALEDIRRREKRRRVDLVFSPKYY